MEVVELSELPMDLGTADRGYAVKVRAENSLFTWNGKQWCKTVDDLFDLPRKPEPGTRCYVRDFEYIYDKGWYAVPADVDMVNHPPHYTRGPKIDGRVIECIEVIRWILDGRLYTAMKYIWRVAFGGKTSDPQNDREDIGKAIWYLQDWLDNPVERQQK
jgi:Protein of unknwon function (DUF3310)